MECSAAADFAGRPRALDEPTRRSRLPGLMGFVLWFPRGRGCSRVGFRRSCFCCGFGARCSRRGLVLRQAAMFVLAARAAMTGLVAPRSFISKNSHCHECTLARPTRTRGLGCAECPEVNIVIATTAVRWTYIAMRSCRRAVTRRNAYPPGGAGISLATLAAATSSCAVMMVL